MDFRMSVPGADGGTEPIIDVDDPEPVPMPSNKNNNEVPGEESVEEKFESSTRKMKNTSICWEFLYFKGTKSKGPDKSKVFCKLCSAGLPYNTTTSNLVDHMKRHHNKEYEKAESKKSEENNNKVSANKISNYLGPNPTKVYKWPRASLKWKAATHQLAKWLCTSSRPTNIVEDKGCVDLMALLATEYELPADQTIANYIRRMYEDEKKIKEKLSKIDHCALTSDGGASSNAVSFQDTNVHFIDVEISLYSRCQREQGEAFGDQLQSQHRRDMLKIKNLNRILTKLDLYSTTLLGSTFVTSSIDLPVVKSLQKHLEDDDAFKNI